MRGDRRGRVIAQYCPPHDYRLAELVGGWEIRECSKCGEKKSTPPREGDL